MKTMLRLLGCLALWLTAVASAVAQYEDPTHGDPIVTIYAFDAEASEGTANTGTLTVMRRGNTNFPLVVFYELVGGASNGVDYQTISSMIEIPAGASEASFTIRPINDDLIEGIERMGASLVPSPLDCATCGYEISYPAGAEVTIYDNDFSRTNRVPPVVNVFTDDDTGREIPEVPPGSERPQLFDPAVFTVVRTGPTNEPLTVYYFIGGVALNGADYVRVPGDSSVPGTVTIPAGVYSANIEIAVIDDALVEGKEIIMLWLRHQDCPWNPPDPACYTVGPQSTASAYILDNDSAATNQPPGAVSIYATDPVAGETPLVSTVPPDTGTFTVRRTDGTNEGIVVFYEISGTASNGVDYQRLSGHVTLPAGVSSAEIVVTPVDDLINEGIESIVVTLIPQCPQCLFTFPPCLPPQGTNCFPIGPDYRAVVSLRDNDVPPTNRPPFVRMDAPEDGHIFYSEGPTNINLVAFAQDAEDGYFVDIEFFEGNRSVGLGMFNPSRCAVCPNYILTWSKVPHGQYVLTAVATDNQGAKGTSAPVSITVIDTRPPGSVNIFATDPVATEVSPLSAQPPDTATFTVRRDDAGTNYGIVVFYEVSGTASNGVDYEPLSGHVTLPPGVASAEIVVAPIDDLIAEGTESVVVTLIPQCPQCLFATPPCLPPIMGTNCFPIGPHRSAVVLLRDNEEPKELPVVNIAARDPVAAEGRTFWWRDTHEQSTGSSLANWWGVNLGGTNTATFVVRRHGPTNAPLVVDYAIGGSASNGVDYAALSGSVTIEAGKRTARVVVVPTDDSLVEGIESVRLEIKSSEDYRIGFPPRAGAIIVDNDRPRPTCRMISNGEFHLCRPATNGFCFRIEASTNLIHWAPICTNVVTDGALHFVDPAAALSLTRFYRVAPEAPLPPDD